MFYDLERSLIIGTIILSVCGLPISFAQIILGAQYLNQCTNKSQVPIFNIVAGVVGLAFEIFILLIACIWSRAQNGRVYYLIILVSGTSFFIFFFGWYIYGVTLISFTTINNAVFCPTPIQQLTDVVVIMYLAPVVLFIILIFCYWFTPSE